ncbi:MAG: hypothetical protein KI792_10015 [Alphaproteobacteria bacterium]|nr:hypothetical protein [Alphaproteobacteria bacterium SS10]
MIRRLTALLSNASPPADIGEVPSTPLADRLETLSRDPYLWVARPPLNIISVFDDLKYDRSDLDMMSAPMRERVINQMAPLGFRQTSGRILESSADDVRVIFPKFQALGASPFDIARYRDRRPQDYLALTPTQTACQLIDHYDHGEAVEQVKALITKQPINIYRLMDYLEHKPAHRDFLNAIGHLKFVQREALESEALKGRRALGSIG